MEKDIKDLKISSSVKLSLKDIGITKVSELKGYNYKTLASKFPAGYNVENIVAELNSVDCLLPPENEISVRDVPMSRRLRNILMRNSILYLSQLSMYSREKILQFRNMGENTMIEFDSLCQEHGIQIRSLAPIKEAFDKYHLPATIYEMFLRNDIACIDDFKQKSANDLYAICERNYMLTLKTYYILKKNGVMFVGWQDKYLFEILPQQKATLIWQKYSIAKISQFSDCGEKRFNEICSTDLNCRNIEVITKWLNLS